VYQNLTLADQKKIARKVKRSRAAGAKEGEESMEAKAHEELELRDTKEFELLVLKIAKTLSDTKLKLAYRWSDFQEMAKRIQDPLKTWIDDGWIVLNDVGCTTMMKDAAIDVLKEKVLVGEKKKDMDMDMDTDDHSKKRDVPGVVMPLLTRNSEQLATQLWVPPNGATCDRTSKPKSSVRRNSRPKRRSSKRILEGMVDGRKKKTEAVKHTAREFWERTHQQHQTRVQARQPTVIGLPDHQLQGPSTILTEASSSAVLGNEDTKIMVPGVAEFWECRENSTKKRWYFFYVCITPHFTTKLMHSHPAAHAAAQHITGGRTVGAN
jgi:hypothetical protein